jgi:hypothetical protein
VNIPSRRDDKTSRADEEFIDEKLIDAPIRDMPKAPESIEDDIKTSLFQKLE